SLRAHPLFQGVVAGDFAPALRSRSTALSSYSPFHSQPFCGSATFEAASTVANVRTRFHFCESLPARVCPPHSRLADAAGRPLHGGISRRSQAVFVAGDLQEA